MTLLDCVFILTSFLFLCVAGVCVYVGIVVDARVDRAESRLAEYATLIPLDRPHLVATHIYSHREDTP